MAITAEDFRARFPVLDTKVHLASCSQGALSQDVTNALARFQSEMVNHPNPWAYWSEEVERARAVFAELIGAPSSTVAVVGCASEGAYQVASGYDWRGGGIVTSTVEFPSIAQVWMAQAARGARVHHARPAKDGWVGLDSFAAVVDRHTRLVATPLIVYQHGQRLPVNAIAELAHAHGAHLFVDAYQGLGVETFDVDSLDCDYLVSGALKYGLGIPGIAFLYVRPGITADLDPQLTGWFGQADPFRFDPLHLEFATDARRFQTGSPPIAAAYGAAAGLGLVQAVGIPHIRARIASLTDLLQESLIAAGHTVASPTDPALRGPQVAVAVEDPDALAHELDRRGIATSPRGRLLRLSLHYYNSPEDIDRVTRELSTFDTGRTRGRSTT